LDIQLSQNLDCGDGTCEVGRDESRSYKVDFLVTANLNEWIGGGFDITISIETESNYNCDGVAGDQARLWKHLAHTAYTLRNVDSNPYGIAVKSGPIVVKSPNNSNNGGYFYRVRKSCRAQGHSYWEQDDQRRL
jgi:hypothetical protein